MAKKTEEKWTYIRVPESAWDIISETIDMDIDSHFIAHNIRIELRRAIEKVEHLTLVSKSEVVLHPGDPFDLTPLQGNVSIKKHRIKKNG